MLASRTSVVSSPLVRATELHLVVASLVIALSACSGDPPADDNSAGASGSSGTSPAGGNAGASGSTGTSGGASGTEAGGTSGTSGSGAGGAGAAGGVTGGSSGASGATTGGTAGAGAGGAGASGAGAGGDAGLGASGGTSGGSSGASGSAGDAGGGGTAGGGGWACPSGVTTVPVLTGTPTRVASVPPPDDFNMDNGNFGNVEGPVWIGDALYVSEMGYMPYDTENSNVRMSRVLKVTSDGTTTIQIADSGSNGLAVDAGGNIVAAVHKDGTLTRFPLPSGTPVPIATTFMDARFNSPNDLAIRSDGNIYFSDPPHQAPNTLPQSATRVYRVAPGGEITPIPNAEAPDQLGNPNGVTLSLNEDFLYVAASVGRRYPVMADGSLGAGTDFPAVSNGDGMVVDCAGNLYVARDQGVFVFTADGTSLGSITVPELQSVTNVAFGGADRQTLYITGLGNQKGLFTLPMNLPGKPY